MATVLPRAAAADRSVQPLAETVARLRRSIPYLDVRVGLPDEPGWFALGELTDPGGTLLGAVLDRIGETAGASRREVMASFFFGGYSWLLAAATVGAFLLDARVPSMAPCDVRVRCGDEGYPSQIALLSGSLTALADDAAAVAAGATIARDGDGLRAAIRREFEAHLAPLVAAVRAQAPIGTRALWLMAGDNLAWPAAHLAGGTGIAAAEAEVKALVTATDAPWRGGTGLLTVERGGQRQTFVERASCCLNYKLPAAEHCATCPLIPAAERRRRALELLEENG